MNNEPIAWMHTNSKQLFATTIPSKRDLHLFTPLYTHPMREFTDTEIKELIDATKAEFKTRSILSFDFAKVFLKKAREK
jgi:hypothetical protein